MTTTLLRAIAALFALTFIAVACAGASGAAWTYAPVTAEADVGDAAEPADAGDPPVDAGTPADADTPAGPGEPADTASASDPAEPAEPAQPAAAGEPRVIELVAEAFLQFTQGGSQITDIPVTPGETILFRVDNTANFPHNFYIGEDAQLSQPNATTETGIPDWSSGVQELTWVVPEDISGLKFGCTVPGHYTLMQGTFSVATAGEAEPAEPETPAEPSDGDADAEAGDDAQATGAPADPAEPAEPAQPAAAGEPRVIELVAEAFLQFTQGGSQITDIPVTPGETILFRVDNTANFPHNFYIGEDAQLSQPNATTETGIPDWSSGVQELTWVVPEDISGLKFGCTVPGHYTLMQGTFSVAP